MYTTDAKVVVFGDVHGAYDAVSKLLEGVGVIDENGRWDAGDTHLVSVGDLVDRGPNSKKVMDLLMRLQEEAEAAGGHVHVLLGNHELMNLGGDLRDVSDAEYAALGGRSGHRQAFSVDGKYGQWLRGLPVAIKVNDTLFAHGGYSATSLVPLDDLNRRFWGSFEKVMTAAQKATASELILNKDNALALPPFEGERPSELDAWYAATLAEPLGPTGLLWYRGNTSCHPLIEATTVNRVLSFHKASRIVVGHTPTATRQIESRLQGKVIAIDTGMLAAVYKGRPWALEINPSGKLVARSADGESREILNRQIHRGGGVRQAEDLVFIKLKERAAKKAVAAYRLSDHLGLDLVPQTELEVNGIRQLQEPVLTERTRLEQKVSRPNRCERESDYDLLAAFDSLIGKTDRTLDNLAYRRRDWQIRALENETGFSSAGRLPTYAHAPKLTRALRATMAAMSEDSLSVVLGELLKPREIRALLKRRDKILEWETLD